MPVKPQNNANLAPPNPRVSMAPASRAESLAVLSSKAPTLLSRGSFGFASRALSSRFALSLVFLVLAFFAFISAIPKASFAADSFDPASDPSQAPIEADSGNSEGAAGSAGGADGLDAASVSDRRIEVTGDPLAVTTIPLKAGDGSAGKAGGANDDLSTPGGKGGAGGSAGDYYLDFKSNVVVFDGNLSFIAGDGGAGGAGGASSGGAAGAGQGGAAGAGGSIIVTFAGDLVAVPSSAIFNLQSGSGGYKGADGDAPGGAGGSGGALDVTIDGSLVVRQTMALNIAFGTSGGSGGGGDRGDLRLLVRKDLDIRAGQIVTMSITGAMSPLRDSIGFGALALGPGSGFDSGGAAVNQKSAAGHYEVGDLDAARGATWTTAGTYAPDADHAVRFDLSGAEKDQSVLSFPGAGELNLTDFDPKAQQDVYLLALKAADLHHYADNPDYREAVEDPAFLTSSYETRSLNLGAVTLVDRTANDFTSASSQVARGADGNWHFVSGNSALSGSEGDLYDDFAFTSGLRRYYWDLYVLESDIDKPLVARNYETADASKVFTQAAAAASLSLAQTFQNTLGAMESVSTDPKTQDHLVIATNVYGSRTKTETGSHAELDNLSATVTLAKSADLGPGDLTIGAFGEFGRGSYDTWASIPRYGEIFGDGEVRTYGGGLFATALLDSGTFLEGSLRGGVAENDFRVDKDPWAKRPGVHSYDSQTDYLGAHLGVGQNLPLGEEAELGAYGRLFWTRTGADEFQTRSGDEVSLNSATSTRLRAGARLSRLFGDGTVKVYAGAAAEREFNGDVSGTLNKDPITNPATTRGTSGFGELGLRLKPDPDGSFSINAEAFGWTGRTKGAGGTAAINLDF